MRIARTKTFEKQYQKLTTKVQSQFDERFVLWLSNPDDVRLRVHSLKGKYLGYWSFNVNGDVRALYRHEDEVLVIFVLIGTHSALYG